jgi:hypothetical protein
MFAQGVSISHCMELRQLREPAPDDRALAKGTAIDVARQIVGVRPPGGLSYL